MEKELRLVPGQLTGRGKHRITKIEMFHCISVRYIIFLRGLRVHIYLDKKNYNKPHNLNKEKRALMEYGFSAKSLTWRQNLGDQDSDSAFNSSLN